MDIDTLGRLASFLASPAKELERTLAIRQGRIESINADGTVNITLGASIDIIPAVHRLNNYGPIQFETVWVLVNDSDLLVLGSNTNYGWHSYTPTFATVEGTGSPALGNGSVDGAYYRIGNILHVRGSIVLGSTTNFGTGRLLCHLPAGYFFGGTNNSYHIISGYVNDVSAGANGNYNLIGRGRGGNGGGTDHNKGFLFTYAGQEVSGSGIWPIGWASGDSISWSGSVEIL